MNNRLEYELGLTEQDFANLRGFDSTATNPIDAAARAAYARNPVAEIPVSQFAVRGGLQFTDATRPRTWDNTLATLPRVGFAYQLNSRTVMRGGWGRSTTPFLFDAINQTGLSQATLLVPTLDNGLTFIANLANPFPSGIGAPPGASQGLATSLGRDLVSNVTSLIPFDRQKAMYDRVLIGAQRDFGGKWLLEANYVAGFALSRRAVSR